ncbi:MAG TPA: S8 family serine peptidase [Solirubrobacterales bacterium]|nr:S8 family serine peptidase [Solirubrobacterales bacterium]
MAGARLAAVLYLVLFATAMACAGPAGAATMPETARPLPARESTPLCSPECEVILAPTEAASGIEYEGDGPGGGFTPQELREAYGLPDQGGAGVTIAVVDGLSDAAAEADLAVYRERFELPECTEANGCFRQLDAQGNPSHPTESGEWVGEISLDLDMVTAACAECRIDLFEGSGPNGLLKAIETAVEMGADVVTDSWSLGFEKGNPANSAVSCSVELCVTPAQEEADDERLEDLDVPILFSGGDYGYGVRFPAASPNVISVGGTRLFHDPDAPRGWSEEVWSNPEYHKDEKGRGTGSGCSIREPKPAWEIDAACEYRIENDVSAIADPRSPVSVYDSKKGGWKLVGGTSASAPFVAGVEGLSSPTTRRLGAAAFWQAGEEGRLFDLATGSDGSCTPPTEDAYWCTAAAGFDGPTGWGAPDGPLSLLARPIAKTEPAGAPTRTGGVLNGTLDNEGAAGAATCAFQVTTVDDPGFSAPIAIPGCEPGTVDGEGPVAVTATVANLDINTSYLYRVVATDGEGAIIYGRARSFRTLPEPPAVTTVGVGTTTPTSVELDGTVDDEGDPGGSSCYFELTAPDNPGFGDSPWRRAAICEPRQLLGSSPEAVHATIEGLDPETNYIFRVEASNAGGGPMYGETVAFSTPAEPPEPPTVALGGVGVVTTTSAELNATVDNGRAADGTRCSFQVTTVTDVEFLSPATLPCEPDPIVGGSPTGVVVTANGLAPITTYLFRVEATNAVGGPVFSPAGSFTTPPDPPSVTAEGTSLISQTEATVEASVDNESASSGSSCLFAVVKSGDQSFTAPYETVPCEPGTVGGHGPVQVHATLTSLDPNTQYRYRVEATNEGGSSVGSADSFTTLPNRPVVTAEGVDLVRATSAQLEAAVDNEGDPAGSSCELRLAAPDDPGFKTPLETLPCEPETVFGEADDAVLIPLEGLAPATIYLYRVEATNRGGATVGATQRFTTEPEESADGGDPEPITISVPLTEASAPLAETQGERSSEAATPETLAPSNRFSIGRVVRHGTNVTLTVVVPGPGAISVSGGSATRRVDAKAIAAGSLVLRVPLTTAITHRAAHDPTLRLKLLVIYTPTGGQPATKRLGVLLGRRLSGR